MSFLRKYGFIILILIGGLLVCDTLILLTITASRSLGIFMPLVIGTPLLIPGIFHKPIFKFFSSKLLGKIIKWFLICGYGLFIVLFSICTIVLITAANNENPKADVLVVLGCGVRGERVAPTLANRLDRAIQYLNDNPTVLVIVSGGKGKGEDISEALAMQRYLTAHNIDEERIFMEDNSFSTEENFIKSKSIIDELFPGGAKVCYVTTDFHVFRAGLVAKKCGLEAVGIGAKGVWYITPNDYLREFVAVAMYLLLGKV